MNTIKLKKRFLIAALFAATMAGSAACGVTDTAKETPIDIYVDGPILQDRYRSNVGQLPIPVVYGMTWGELAGGHRCL